MVRRVLCQVALIVLSAAAPVFAQSPRVEVSGLVGWTFSDGVTGDAILADSFSWGFGIGALATDNVEVGFLYGRQESRLDVTGTNTVEVGDMAVSTYHGYFAYNFGAADSTVRPYVFGGVGATCYGSVPFTFAGVARKTGGDTAPGYVFPVN